MTSLTSESTLGQHLSSALASLPLQLHSSQLGRVKHMISSIPEEASQTTFYHRDICYGQIAVRAPVAPAPKSFWVRC
jgi:hypothetical protein